MIALQPAPGKRMLDATFGRGGHSRALLERGAAVVALDQDPDAEDQAGQLAPAYPGRFTFHRENFRNLARVRAEEGLFDGILFDLGVSSPQLDTAARGFSFQQDGPLDMRMDPRQQLTAADLVNGGSESELTSILFQYGEEPQARRIVKTLVREREREPILRTGRLAALVEKTLGGRRERKIHPATKTFQALRIAVNGELDALREALAEVPASLNKGGRMAVISFHALEDRMVKEFVARHSEAEIRGTYAFGLPNPEYCLKKTGRWLPSEAEVERNPRARSARLRGAEKIA